MKPFAIAGIQMQVSAESENVTARVYRITNARKIARPVDIPGERLTRHGRSGLLLARLTGSHGIRWAAPAEAL